MKFSNEDFANLKIAIKQQNINLAKLRKEYLMEGKSNTRFYWDVYWKSNWSALNRNGRYNDSHIETAIKKAIQELELEMDINTQKNELSEKMEAGIATDAEIDEAMQKEFEFAAKYF